MRPAATLPVHRVPGTDYVLVDYGGLKGCRFRWQLVRGYGWTDYRQYWTRARILATRPADGATVHLCGHCSKLAGPINAGFTDHQPLATVWRGPAAREAS